MPCRAEYLELQKLTEEAVMLYSSTPQNRPNDAALCSLRYGPVIMTCIAGLGSGTKGLQLVLKRDTVAAFGRSGSDLSEPLFLVPDEA